MSMTRLRRLVLAALPVALLAAACGGEEDTASTSTPAPSTPAPSSSAGTAGERALGYPVSVEHAHGSTTIEAAPQRIVTLGYNDQDFLLAFGVAPIGVTDWYGDFEYATWPWAQDALGDATPAVLNQGAFTGTANFNYEAITALDPDLILALYVEVDDTAYGLLSAIAPTVVRTAEHPDFGMPWQATTRLVGEVLAQPDTAEALIADVEQRFADAAAAHPEFAGKTVAVAEFNAPGSSFVRSANDQRTQLLTQLGFAYPDDLAELTGDLDGIEVSDERMTLLDRDLLVWNIGFAPEARADIEAKPLYRQLQAVQDGHSIFVDDPLVSGALTWGTVLSLPYALDAIVPQVAAALA